MYNNGRKNHHFQKKFVHVVKTSNISFGASSLALTQNLRESEEHFSSSLLSKFFLHYLFLSPNNWHIYFDPTADTLHCFTVLYFVHYFVHQVLDIVHY